MFAVFDQEGAMDLLKELKDFNMTLKLLQVSSEVTFFLKQSCLTQCFMEQNG